MTSMSTAIIMVAVLTIANLFAFGVMSTGFLTAARAKQAAQGGVGESISTLQPKGAVIASGDTAKNAVNHIRFKLSGAPGADHGEPGCGKHCTYLFRPE